MPDERNIKAKCKAIFELFKFKTNTFCQKCFANLIIYLTSSDEFDIS